MVIEKPKWAEETDVLVVGYGGAGAITAITAHDAGARVVIIEKQPSDTPTRTRHTPNTRLCGGGWFCPADVEKAILYLEGMARIANETLDAERKELISTFVRYSAENTTWIKRMIGDVIGLDRSPFMKELPLVRIAGKSAFYADFPELPGADGCSIFFPKAIGEYRDGPAHFKGLAEAVRKRKIPVLWETEGGHLVTEDGEVRGILAKHKSKEIAIKASRAVVLTCGGFEFNQRMKEDYLRVNPTYFYGNPANTGDGIRMTMEVGAALWHMNSLSWRVTMKFPDAPIFCTQRHETSSIFVDKRGNRFANERFKLHAFGYELMNYDCDAMCYRKIPCYWIFDEKRRVLAPLATLHGSANPPGGIMGDMFYVWSSDNQKEIDQGWVMKSNTIDELANKILADPDNNGLMSPSVLSATVKRYNQHCRQGKDLDFGKPKEWLQPLEDPPYYAVKLWPGGPNTQGGPKRNVKGQVLRSGNTPIPRLYSAGELGSIWGMLYQGGGNIAENIVFGRIAGVNAADEKPFKY